MPPSPTPDGPEQEVSNMSNTRKDKRTSNRRKALRRTEDMPHGESTGEQHDISWKFLMDIDRRAEERRSGEDRRKD